nr:Isocitrate dehydrogenase [NADP] [Ipomoea batatas]
MSVRLEEIEFKIVVWILMFTPSKNGCCLISVAPRLYARRFCGSFTSRPRIRSLAEKLTTGDSGKRRGCPTTLKRVDRLSEPLKGVLPNNNSYRKIPKVHQSTALPCPSPLIISGARYSWVPTNDMERAPVGSAMSSGKGLTWLPTSFLGLGFLSFFDLPEKKRGPKHVVGTAQDGWMQEGSMQAAKGEVKIGEHNVSIVPDKDVFGLEVSKNAFLVASAEVCASLLRDKTPSQDTKTFPSRNGYINSEEMDGPEIAVSLFLFEHGAISFGLPAMLYP